MNIVFMADAWEEYTEWLKKDRKILEKINDLIKDICRNGVEAGTGKPERLRYRAGYNRRINKEHRLIYLQEGKDLLIISCRGHYSD